MVREESSPPGNLAGVTPVGNPVIGPLSEDSNVNLEVDTCPSATLLNKFLEAVSLAQEQDKDPCLPEPLVP